MLSDSGDPKLWDRDTRIAEDLDQAIDFGPHL